MNQVHESEESWSQIATGIICVQIVAVVIFAVVVAWRMGLYQRMRALGGQLESVGLVPALFVISEAVSIVAIVAGKHDEFAVAVSGVLAVVACASAWLLVFIVRDHAGLVRQAWMGQQLAPVGAGQASPWGPYDSER